MMAIVWESLILDDRHHLTILTTNLSPRCDSENLVLLLSYSLRIAVPDVCSAPSSIQVISIAFVRPSLL